MSGSNPTGEIFVENPPIVYHYYTVTSSGVVWHAVDEPAAIAGAVLSSGFGVNVASGGRATDLTLESSGGKSLEGITRYTDTFVSGSWC